MQYNIYLNTPTPNFLNSISHCHYLIVGFKYSAIVKTLQLKNYVLVVREFV